MGARLCAAASVLALLLLLHADAGAATHGLVTFRPTEFACGWAPANGSLVVGALCVVCGGNSSDARSCRECPNGDCSLLVLPGLRAGTCAAEQVCLYGDCGSACAHKGLVPVSGMDVAFVIVNFFGSVASILGGIGGGGFFVPLLMAMTGFGVHEAVPMSKAMIFAGAIVTLFFEVRRKTSDGRRVVDYDACLILQPLCLAGVVFGVYLNVLLPQWLIVVVLVLVLGMSTYKTLQKAVQQRRKAAADAATSRASAEPATSPSLLAENADSPDGVDVEAVELRVRMEDTATASPDNDDADIDDNDSAALLSSAGHGASEGTSRKAQYDALVRRGDAFPWARVAGLAFIWAVVVGSAVLKALVGNCPHPQYWLISALPLLVGVPFTWWFGRLLRAEYEVKVACGHQFGPTDFVWNVKHTVQFPLIAFGAGVAAGLVGIGGGMVIGPILLAMTREPDPNSATSISNVLVLFTSSSSTVQYAVLGRLQWDYALFFSATTVCASLLASGVIKPWIGTPGRRAMFLFLMGGVIGCSGLVTLVMGIVRMVQEGVSSAINADALCGR